MVTTHEIKSVVTGFIDIYDIVKIFMLQQQQNLGRKFGTSKMHLSPPVALTAVRSKAVVLLLLIRC